MMLENIKGEKAAWKKDVEYLSPEDTAVISPGSRQLYGSTLQGTFLLLPNLSSRCISHCGRHNGGALEPDNTLSRRKSHTCETLLTVPWCWNRKHCVQMTGPKLTMFWVFKVWYISSAGVVGDWHKKIFHSKLDGPEVLLRKEQASCLTTYCCTLPAFLFSLHSVLSPHRQGHWACTWEHSLRRETAFPRTHVLVSRTIYTHIYIYK